MPGWGLYFPSKVAVASMSESLWRELHPKEVRVYLVEPGPFQTEFGQKPAFDNTESGFHPALVTNVILRLCQRPRQRVIVPFCMAPLVRLSSGVEHILGFS